MPIFVNLYYVYLAYSAYDSLEGGVGGKNWMKKYGLDTMNNRAGDKKRGRRRRGLEIEYSGTAEPRRVIYGRQKIAGMHTIPPYCSGSKGELLHMVYTIAGHECYDIGDVWFDNYQILDANIGAVTGSSLNDGYVADGPYKTLTWIRRYLGTPTQTADYILTQTYPSAFTSDFRGRGICYAAIQLKWEQNVFATGQPDVTFDVKGKKIYDPRLDDTNGGTGAHRYTDSTTWEYSTNPALCVRDYLVNEVGFANDEIDDTLVASAAAICDAPVDVPTASTQARYTTNITLYADDDWKENLQDLIDTMHGWVAWSDGKWRIYAGAWNSSSTPPIEKKDWVSEISVRTSWDRAERWNAVRVFYIDPDRNWQTVECYPRRNPAYETADGGERIWKEVDLPGCINEYEAQRHAELWLRKSRNQITVSGELRPEFMQLSPSDTVTLTDDEFGWSSKTFRVVSMDMTASGSVAVTLIEEGSTMWDDLAEGDYDSPLGSTDIDPGATYPSAPVSLTASGGRGYIDFAWDVGSEDLRGQSYRLIESPTSYQPDVFGSEVWRGLAAQATVYKTDTTTRWYWVQGIVGSYLSGYWPNSWGVTAAASTAPADGTPGTYAPGLMLQATAQQFRYSGSGTNIGVSTIGFDALLTALPGATAGFYANNYLANGTLINSLDLAGTGNTNRGFHINSFTQGGSTAYATIVASVSGGYFDRMTVVRLQEGVAGGDGEGGLVGLLTNENHSLPASYNGYIPSYGGAVGEFQVFKGVDRVSTNSITFSTGVSSPSGLTKAITSAGSYSVTAGIGVNDAMGMQVFRATAFGVDIDKVFTVGKNMTGTPGDPGDPGDPGESDPFAIARDPYFERSWASGSYWTIVASGAFTNSAAASIVGSNGVVGGYINHILVNTLGLRKYIPTNVLSSAPAFQSGALIESRIRWRRTTAIVGSGSGYATISLAIGQCTSYDQTTGDLKGSNAVAQMVSWPTGLYSGYFVGEINSRAINVWQEDKYTHRLTEVFSTTYSYVVPYLYLYTSSRQNTMSGTIELDGIDFRFVNKSSLDVVPQKSSGVAYTIGVNDAGGHLNTTSGDVTVPAGTFQIGSVICVYNSSGSTRNLVAASGVTLRLSGTATTGSPRTIAVYGIVTLLCIGDNDFLVTGNVS